jgi:hypothetical protein
MKISSEILVSSREYRRTELFLICSFHGSERTKNVTYVSVSFFGDCHGYEEYTIGKVEQTVHQAYCRNKK